jgi:general secretion pathway protein G
LVEKDMRYEGKNKGFTLVELMIVIAIIGILATLAIPTYKYANIRAKEAVLKENLFRLRDTLDQFYADRERYPETLEELVKEGYLRKIPLDPMTEASDTWELIYEELAEGEEDKIPGISDVRSSSYETALDGTIYNNW